MEASVLADALSERYMPMGAEGRIYRGVALSIARSTRGRLEEGRALADDAASIARSTDSHLLRALALEHLAEMQNDTISTRRPQTLREVAEIHAAAGQQGWGSAVCRPAPRGPIVNEESARIAAIRTETRRATA